MELNTIQQRLESIDNQIAKKQNSIETKKAKLNRIKKNLEKYNIVDTFRDNLWNTNSKIAAAAWDGVDIEYIEDDIKRLEKEITNLQEKKAEYENSKTKATIVDNKYSNDIPEIFKALENQLVVEWDEFDKNMRDKMKEKYHSTGSLKDIDYNLLYKSDADIHKDNVKDAKHFILNLYNRVYKITGDVESWNNITLTQGSNGPVLTGTVFGKLGAARVETILAGGYNIQRLHIRVLVKNI